MNEDKSAIGKLKHLYERIFTIKSTGDPKHPVQGCIDDDAKAVFEAALEDAAQNSSAVPAEPSKTEQPPEREFDHFSIVPFKAICGADVPNQSTTQIPERAKCATCWFYWKEFASSRTFAAAPSQSESVWATIKSECRFCGSMVEHVCTAFFKGTSRDEDQENNQGK